MSFNTRKLDRLGKQLSIPINADEDGYLGRECPVEECLGYFKITPGTGIKGQRPATARTAAIAATAIPSSLRSRSNTASRSRSGNLPMRSTKI